VPGPAPGARHGLRSKPPQPPPGAGPARSQSAGETLGGPHRVETSLAASSCAMDVREVIGVGRQAGRGPAGRRGRGAAADLKSWVTRGGTLPQRPVPRQSGPGGFAAARDQNQRYWPRAGDRTWRTPPAGRPVRQAESTPSTDGFTSRSAPSTGRNRGATTRPPQGEHEPRRKVRPMRGRLSAQVFFPPPTRTPQRR